MSHDKRYRCDGCGKVFARIDIPADDVGSVRHNCDGMAGDVVRDVLLGRGRRGRISLTNEDE